MTGAASVAGRERLRLFCALMLPEHVLDALERWQRAELRSDARMVRRDHLHITLAFLGHRPASELEPIAEALLGAAAGVEAPLLSPSRYRETRSVGMLVLDDEGGRAAALAKGLHEELEALGVYERERRPWLPHVTVLRFRRPPRLRPPLPGLPPFAPSGAAVYHSLLRPGGAQYDVLNLVALGG
jgi:RNA 2',3'-cyclic 3'-phosphodiesterase